MNSKAGVLVGVVVVTLAFFYVWRELNAGVALTEPGIHRDVMDADRARPGVSSDVPFTPTAVDAESPTRGSRHLVSDPLGSITENSTGEPFEITGEVVDPTGEAYRDATIHVREQVESRLHSDDVQPFTSMVVSGIEGEFAVGVPRPGKYAVWVAAYGFARSGLAWVTIDPEGAHGVLTLVLEKSKTISGVVLGDDMLPVKGVDVVAYVDADLARVPLPSGVTSLELYGLERTKSAEDGSFRLGPMKGLHVPYLIQGTRPSGPMTRFDPKSLSIVEDADSFEGLFGELENIAPGSSELRLLLSSAPLMGTLRIELATDDGGLFPGELTGVLEQLGPNQGVYLSRKVDIKIDDVGVGRLSGLIPGRRYSLELKATPGGSELKLGPFFATGGEIVLRATLPGLFETKVQVNDPHGRVPGHARLLIMSMPSGCAPSTVAQINLGDADGEHVILAPAGKYFVHIGTRIWTSEGTKRALPPQEVQIPLLVDRVLIEVP